MKEFIKYILVMIGVVAVILLIGQLFPPIQNITDQENIDYQLRYEEVINYMYDNDREMYSQMIKSFDCQELDKGAYNCYN